MEGITWISATAQHSPTHQKIQGIFLNDALLWMATTAGVNRDAAPSTRLRDRASSRASRSRSRSIRRRHARIDRIGQRRVRKPRRMPGGPSGATDRVASEEPFFGRGAGQGICDVGWLHDHFLHLTLVLTRARVERSHPTCQLTDIRFVLAGYTRVQITMMPWLTQSVTVVS